MFRLSASKPFHTRIALGRVGASRGMAGGSHMHDNDPEIIEKELKRQKKHEDTLMKHAPGWSEVMASVSEANIKADQHEGQIDVKETIEHIKKQHNGYEKVTVKDATSTASSRQAEPEENHTIDPSDKEVMQGPLGRTPKTASTCNG